jgi:PAS domain S-box-containing protein
MLPPPFPPDEAARLASLRALGVLDTAAEERFDRITRLAQALFGVPIALVTLVDADRQWFKSKQGLEATGTPRAISFCGHAVLGDSVFEVHDATLDERFADNPLVTGAPDIRFYAGHPLSAPDGQTVGTLCLIDRVPRVLTDAQKRILGDLAELVERELAASAQAVALSRLSEVDERSRGRLGGERQRAALGFGAALTLTVAMAAVSLHGARHFAETSRWVAHTREVLQELTGLVAQAKEEQADARGFVITGDEAFLHQPPTGQSIPARVERLRALVADSPVQTGRVEALARLARQRTDDTARTVAVRREKGREAASRLVASRGPQKSMDALTSAVAEMEELERRLLDERESRAAAESRRLAFEMFGGAFGGSLILLLAFLVVRRDMEARARAEAGLTATRDAAMGDAEALRLAKAESSRINERLQAVLDHMDSGVALVDPAGKLLVFNLAAERIHGAWRDDMERLRREGGLVPMRPDGSPLPPDEDPLGRALAKGESVRDCELFFRTKYRPGGYHLSASAAPMKDRNGMITAAVLVFRDITESVRAQRLQGLSNEVSRVLAQAAPGSDPIPDLLRALGERMGWVYAGFWTPSAGALRLESLWSFASGGPVAAFVDASRTMRFAPGVGLPGRVWRERRPAWIDDVTTAQNFPLAAAAAAAGLRGAFAFPAIAGERVLGVVEVISARIEQPDEDLLRLVAALGAQIGVFLEGRRALEERTRFFNLSLDMMCIAGFDGRFKVLNSVWQKTLGWAPEEMLGIPFLDLAHPDDRRATMRQAALSARGEAVFQFENRYRCKDGSYRWLTWAIVSVPSEGAVYATARDVTERKREMAELAEARDAALSAAKFKADFLANMSHEIRTPMNAIIGMTGLLLDTHLEARQREHVEIVRDAGDALLTLINDILDYSKIEAGKMQLDCLDFDLRETLERSAELVAPRAQAKGLEVTISIPPATPTALRGDPGRLRQIVLNLLSNAVKFTEKGEVSMEVSSTPAGERSRVRIAVRDTGIGISSDERERLFHSFSQVDASTTRKYGGTGLGLAISKQLVELMGGAIGVESVPGRGSTFWFEIPFETGAIRRAGEVHHPAELAAVRIIVVDDSATNREIVRGQLAGWGMSCDAAAGAEEALAAMRRAVVDGHPYGAALVDLQMPGVDGLELAARLKEDPGLGRPTVILMTSLDTVIAPGEMSAAGLAACLTKPVRQSTLHDALMTALSRRGAAPRAPAASPAAAPAPSRRLRVLVVEDNAVNQKVAVLLLQKMGHAADAVGGGGEALESLRAIRYDLVLMDCQMPDMDGYEATRRLRAREAQTGAVRIPVIALTANAMSEDRQKCLDAGMDAYLPKPVRPADLARALAAYGRSAVRPEVVRDLREMAGAEAFAQIVREFLANSASLLGQLRASAERSDTDSLRRDVHSLKGSSGSLGADGVCSACGDLEVLLDAGAPRPALTAAVAALETAFASAREALSASI